MNNVRAAFLIENQSPIETTSLYPFISMFLFENNRTILNQYKQSYDTFRKENASEDAWKGNEEDTTYLNEVIPMGIAGIITAITLYQRTELVTNQQYLIQYLQTYRATKPEYTDIVKKTYNLIATVGRAIDATPDEMFSIMNGVFEANQITFGVNNS